jgi:hypothetical protein
MSSLIVSDYAVKTSTFDLQNAFSRFGKLYQVMKQARYAVVDYYERKDAERAVGECHGKPLLGSARLIVKLQNEGGARRADTSSTAAKARMSEAPRSSSKNDHPPVEAAAPRTERGTESVPPSAGRQIDEQPPAPPMKATPQNSAGASEGSPHGENGVDSTTVKVRLPWTRNSRPR